MSIKRSYRYRKILQDGSKQNPVGKPKGYVDLNSKSTALRREFGLRHRLTTRQVIEFMVASGISTGKYAERCLQLLLHGGDIERVSRGVYKLKEAA